MSLRHKKSTASLTRQNTSSTADVLSLSRSDTHTDKHSLDARIDKKIMKLSHFFHRAKTDDSMGLENMKHSLGDSGSESEYSEDIPPPMQLRSNSLYSLKNDSSGTLTNRNLSNDSYLGANNVEFNNVRNNSFTGSSGSGMVSSNASIYEKTKDSKLGRFLHKTGHKVKKLSDINNETLNGLGLSLHTEGHQHHHAAKELKSPIGRNFGGKMNSEQKTSFGDKLKLLNSTKYKNYHYHNILRKQKDSIKNGMKIGTKTNDIIINGKNYTNNISGSSYALSDINVGEVEMMITSQVLNFEQCEQYSLFLFGRIQHLLLPLFKGENLKCPIEDVTKLVSLYVRIRKLQEETIKASDGRSSFSKTIKTVPSLTQISTSAYKFEDASDNGTITDDDDNDQYKTPFMKPTASFIGSPMTNESRLSSGLYSPIIQTGPKFDAMSKVLDEIRNMLRSNMNVMINQLFYDEPKDSIKFIRGTNDSLRKRVNTINSLASRNGTRRHSSSVENEDFGDSFMDNSFFVDQTYSNSVMDLPIVAPSQSSIFTDTNDSVGETRKTSASFMDNTRTSIYTNHSVPTNDILAASESDDAGTTSRLLGLGMLPPGRFEKCTSILWDIFQRDILFELSSILLPIELEFANGHREKSNIHRQADSILYNGGEKIHTFTNTLIHPEISGSAPKLPRKDTMGSLGEWSDLNIHDTLLLVFRDHVIIPLYEMNRKFEERDDPDVSFQRSVRGRAGKNGTKYGSLVDMEEYRDAASLVQCFQRVCGVATNDTNQKLVENLLQQIKMLVSDLEHRIHAGT